MLTSRSKWRNESLFWLQLTGDTESKVEIQICRKCLGPKRWLENWKVSLVHNLPLWDDMGGKANLGAAPGVFALSGGQIISTLHLHISYTCKSNYWFAGENDAVACCRVTLSRDLLGMFILLSSWGFIQTLCKELWGGAVVSGLWISDEETASPVGWEDKGVLVGFSGLEVSNGKKMGCVMVMG